MEEMARQERRIRENEERAKAEIARSIAEGARTDAPAPETRSQPKRPAGERLKDSDSVESGTAAEKRQRVEELEAEIARLERELEEQKKIAARVRGLIDPSDRQV